ncbi:glutaredoxin domain-containing protein [Chloroflexota bacterium]
MGVKIYTTPTCGYCHQVKGFLSERGVRYTEYDVSRDRAAADEMVRLTGQMGVPVILVDEQAVIGFDRPRLESLLARSGNGHNPRFGLKVADAGKVAGQFGAVVGAVAPSSLGERAGLRRGDIITEVNLRRINNADDLEHALAGLIPGNRVAIIFLRNGGTLRSEIVV